jgi:hypothetical protein
VDGDHLAGRRPTLLDDARDPPVAERLCVEVKLERGETRVTQSFERFAVRLTLARDGDVCDPHAVRV